MSHEKPNVNEVWASNSLAELENPDTSAQGGAETVATGWTGEILPPRQWFNYEQNRQGQFNQHINIEGIPVWDKDTPYIRGSIQKDPTDKKTYECLSGTDVNPNLGNQPSLNLATWKKWIETDQEVIITPAWVSPITFAEVVDVTPTLVSTGFRTIMNVAHAATEFRVARDEAMTDITNLSGTLGAVVTWDVTPALASGTTYYWDVRYQDADGTWSNRSIPANFQIPTANVQTPTNTLPTDLDSAVTDSVTLIADTFSSAPTSVHLASHWQISKDSNFATVEIDSGEDTNNLLSFTSVTELATTYYWRVRYKSATLGWSAFSTETSFTTISALVQRPTNLTPVNAATELQTSTELTADTFTTLPAGTQTHTGSQWQVADDAGFTSVIFDSGDDAVNLMSIVATGLLENSTYYWRVRYKGSTTGFSNWSNTFSMQTKIQFADWIGWFGDQGAAVQVTSLFANGGNSTGDLCKLNETAVLYGFNQLTTFELYVHVVDINGLVASIPNPVGNTQQLLVGSGDCVEVTMHYIEENKAMMVWRRDASTIINARVITYYGGVLELGSTVTLAGDSEDFSFMRHSVTKIDNTRFLITYTGQSRDSNCGLLTITGDTLSMGTISVFSGPNNMYTQDATYLGNDRVAILAKDSITNSAEVRIITIAGNGALSSGIAVTKVLVSPSSSSGAITATADGKFTYGFHNNQDLEIYNCTHIGTAVTIGAPATVANSVSGGNKFEMVSPVEGQVFSVVYEGSGPSSDMAFRGTDVSGATPVINAAAYIELNNYYSLWSGWAVMDDERIAQVFTPVAGQTKVRVLDGSAT